MSENNRLEWTEFAIPWLFERGVVRILQKRGGVKRDATQTAMLLKDPEALVAPYMRKMMSFLLFNAAPTHILMIGLGGGSLPSFVIAICQTQELRWRRSTTA